MTDVATKQKALEVALEQLKKRQAEAKEHEQSALRAAEAFKRNPDDKTFTEKAVAEQRAQNAREAAENFKHSELEDAKHALEKAEGEEKRAQILEARKVVQARVERFHASFRQAIDDLDDAIRENRSLKSLGASLGVNSGYDFSAHLRGVRGLNSELGLVPGTIALGTLEPIEVQAEGGNPRIMFKFTRDAEGRGLRRSQGVPN